MENRPPQRGDGRKLFVSASLLHAYAANDLLGAGSHGAESERRGRDRHDGRNAGPKASREARREGVRAPRAEGKGHSRRRGLLCFARFEPRAHRDHTLDRGEGRRHVRPRRAAFHAHGDDRAARREAAHGAPFHRREHRRRKLRAHRRRSGDLPRAAFARARCIEVAREPHGVPHHVRDDRQAHARRRREARRARPRWSGAEGEGPRRRQGERSRRRRGPRVRRAEAYRRRDDRRARQIPRPRQACAHARRDDGGQRRHHRHRRGRHARRHERPLRATRRHRRDLRRARFGRTRSSRSAAAGR